jgi:hypothetical protein
MTQISRLRCVCVCVCVFRDGHGGDLSEEGNARINISVDSKAG